MMLLSGTTYGQEHTGHLNFNPILLARNTSTITTASKTTATEPLMLPFFEDFAYDDIFPDAAKWTNKHTYINNRMGSNPISRGVATFDALDWRGIPYDSFSNTIFRYADSLTSQPINLSLNVVVPDDSIYLSFFYQPQGNSFYPLPQDSLMLFFRTKHGGYKKVWSVQGSTLRPFQQVMIPISDSLYFDSFFQFTFINKAALYWADAIWNVDYIRLGTGRSLIDTAVNDIGFTSDPSFLLNDYTSMPYRQFFTNPAGERATQFTFSIRNNYFFPQSGNNAYSAAVIPFGTILKSPTYTTATIPAQTTQSISTPSYVTLIPLSSIGLYDKVTFQNKFFIQSISSSDPPENDTIIRNQVFDNYLAYDDGSAEKSYYLSLYPTLPGRLAIEHHLNRPDTLRGLAIYFGRQIPFAFNKGFDIQIYRSLAGVNGAPADELIYTKEYCYPGYADTMNNFWVYSFEEPVPLTAGIFFAGIFLPAESGSDSLYFGLDVNRVGFNHAYYNVLSSWVPSLISGAIMIRPLLGKPVIGTETDDVPVTSGWQLYPNPARDEVQVSTNRNNNCTYNISDIQGRTVLSGTVAKDGRINISQLATGLYIVRLASDEQMYAPAKLIKE